MKTEAFSEALGNINDRYLEEALAYRPRRWRRPLICAAAACLCLVIGFSIWHKSRHPWPVKYVERPAETTLAEIAIIPHWEDEPVYAQYPSVEYAGREYTAHAAIVPADRLGASLGTVTAIGWDHYAAEADAEKRTEAIVYAIDQISEACAIAIRYPESEECYAMVNSRYRPATLGQFIADLNLQAEVSFGTVYYSYRTSDGDYTSVQFEDVDSERIWSLLLSATQAENVYDDLQDMPKRILGISVDLPLLGYKNISLSVLEGGYIDTNILDTGKMFYVGEENTQAFVNYVLNECQGYEIVYITEEAEETENDSATEELTVVYTSEAAAP